MKPLLFLLLVELALAVTGTQEVAVHDLKVAVSDKDAISSGLGFNSVVQFSKLSKTLEGDISKHIYISFSVKTKSDGKVIRPHQAFIVFQHESGEEVIYIADAEPSGIGYVLDIDLAKSHKDFEGLSGKYSTRLVVGDISIKTQIDWIFADIKLSLPAPPVLHVPKSEQVNYKALTEIKHQFRQPEKRPAGVVSDAFTLICLVPIGILLVLWFRIGINFGNMPLSVWTLLFHGGLAALFGLYFVFWVKLNMFETLNYLSIIGGLTFLSGNRMLRALANQRKQKAV